MSLFTESKVRARARSEATNFSKSAASVLTERVQKQAGEGGHDIFLSHAFEDREMLAGTVLLIGDLGHSVYLNWREDPTLDRKHVTPATAAKLRERMKASRSLLRYNAGCQRLRLDEMGAWIQRRKQRTNRYSTDCRQRDGDLKRAAISWTLPVRV